MKRFQLVALRKAEFEKIKYERVYWENFDYSFFKKILTIRSAGRGSNCSYNDVIIGADTETSKKQKNDVVYEKNGKKRIIAYPNHVVLWTISIRVYGSNIVTLYGRKPSDMIRCIGKMHRMMRGEKTIIYFHNWPYDYVYLRKFMFKKWGFPEKTLNIKPHYPLFTYFSNGIMIKDSLALAQRGLDKWSSDLDISHKKLVGQYNYNLIRSQFDDIPDEEIEYAEFDTVGLCECIDKTMEALNKKIYSIPYTATGIVREMVRKEGKKHKAHDEFVRNALSFEQYLKLLKVYHGGYTHANRHKIGQHIRPVNNQTIKCFDFASSYPFVLLTEKYPNAKFIPMDDCSVDEILEDSDNYAYMFKLVVVGYSIKDDNIVMPPISLSKCEKIVNPVCDNGRVLSATYLETYINEVDLEYINKLSKWQFAKCVEVEFAHKAYLPRWFTDLVFSLFVKKTSLKPMADINPVAYSLAKSALNALYGMCCQKYLKDTIDEAYITGEYTETNAINEEAYNKYINRPTSMLQYSTGVWCTSYAQRNLFELCNTCTTSADWLYSDTDSGYSLKWDLKAIARYNERCKQKLKDNGYDCVKLGDCEYWLGVAEHEFGKDEYTEFCVMGAKRYCGRQLKDGQLHITVAGVPKKGALCLKDNIENFKKGFIFDGETTGKKTHAYIYVDDIYTDEKGNETGDSVDLYECEYALDDVTVYNWDDIALTREESLQVYD